MRLVKEEHGLVDPGFELNECHQIACIVLRQLERLPHTCAIDWQRRLLPQL